MSKTIENARELRGTIASLAPEVERRRGLPAPILEALRAADVDCVLQRPMRDAHAIVQHVALSRTPAPVGELFLGEQVPADVF